MRHVLHRQQRMTTCAVAAVRTVLHAQFGLRISESALVALGTRPHKPIVREGSTTTDMRRMVHGASLAYNTGVPWRLRSRRSGTWSDLRRELATGWWPIVEVYQASLQEYHAVVIVDIETDRVRVFDPDYSRSENLQWMAKDRFMGWWTNPQSGERWYAVITGEVL